jgi:hypothetical protein
LRTHVEAHPSNLSHGRNQRKSLQIARMKIMPKIPLKINNMKNISAHREVIQSKPINVLMQIKSLHGVETATISSHSLEDWRDLSLSLISYTKKHTHTSQKATIARWWERDG